MLENNHGRKPGYANARKCYRVAQRANEAPRKDTERVWVNGSERVPS